MSYCLRNSEYDKKYGNLRNVLPYMVRVKQYGKHMVTLQIGCYLGCQWHNCRCLFPSFLLGCLGGCWWLSLDVSKELL